MDLWPEAVEGRSIVEIDRGQRAWSMPRLIVVRVLHLVEMNKYTNSVRQLGCNNENHRDRNFCEAVDIRWVGTSHTLARSYQKTVPSEMMPMGGPFVIGRETCATSLPPWTIVSHENHR